MELWKKNPVIYEINTWVWLWELSREAGYVITLGNIPEEKLDEFVHLNLEAIWLMGVWYRSPAVIAISNHHAVNLVDFKQALP
ncbi:MAG: alpha-amylase, partial [Bacteroidota bacterium]